MILKEQLDEFKKIYKEKFGEESSDEEARESAEKILSLVKIVYKPTTTEEYKKLQKNSKK